MSQTDQGGMVLFPFFLLIKGPSNGLRVIIIIQHDKQNN